jgi:Flp pilus assembly protein TadB
MVELAFPELARDPFREHYRELILRSLLRAAEARSAEQRGSGHRRRAARAERQAARLRATSETPAAREPAAAGGTSGGRLRASIRVGWLTTLVLVVLALAVFGIDSWATSVADVALIVVTVAWFWAWAHQVLGAGEPEVKQLKLFSQDEDAPGQSFSTS